MNEREVPRRGLALALLPHAGPQFWQRVLDHWGDPLAVLSASASNLKAIGLRSPGQEAVRAWQNQDLSHPFLQRIEQAGRVCEDLQVTLLAWTDPRYPAALRQIHTPPVALFVRGNVECLGSRQLAVVGSRRATRDGLSNARQFARAVVGHRLAITSGLALGIDGAAHEGALDGDGTTIAVLGTGIDTLYPAHHKDLAERIVAGGGAIVAELPPGSPPRAGHFPRRNRIISGLAQGVLVVEASLASGSLITARLALEQGRDVLAIPGSIHNPQARGCHRLIRDGACLVETVDDILAELNTWTPALSFGDPVPQAETGTAGLMLEAPQGTAGQVWLQLGLDARDTDDLVAQTGLDAGSLLQALLELELEGHIEAVPGGYRRVPASSIARAEPFIDCSETRCPIRP
ncbi:DNA-processing protein DprA [Hydrocarboniclastica marina]|uniref:DNA-protecting protein DprA n=1 Tax=Hydrocarboniclastica marina TaxID=2259620 RepID=A0A4P7XEH9_9ALTE|nr:DNA-processing protein DprA [Hydrocarboniclastica marina]MAM00475.1 DNA-protecting protein DprA [Alteromonadaceae bacterium]QCF24492.1 DNA-protecting protein DprA [Hydrocarboniclastica marina]